jgi:hypothetical protein
MSFMKAIHAISNRKKAVMDLDDGCAICCEAYTASLKKAVTCPYCNVAVCMQCAKKCAISWASQPKCPSCNKGYTHDTLEAMFPKSFRRGDLRRQVIANLQDQEMSLLPATAATLAEIARSAKWTAEASALAEATSSVLHRGFLADFDIDDTLAKIRSRVFTLRSLGEHPRIVEANNKKGPVQHKTVKCPGDACLGFIPHSGPGAGFCGLCDMRVCKECNKALPDRDAVRAHAASGCADEDKAAWALIVSTSVMCPKCGTPIQKIDGCNQMWCTVKDCNTAFDWATGRVVNGPIHNPHYHEWLRQGGHAAPAANLDCTGLPHERFNYRAITHIHHVLDEERNGLYETFENRKTYWIFNQWIRVLPETVGLPAQQTEYNPHTHEDLRIKYLNKEITKVQWATKLSHRETLRIKNNRLAALCLMFQTASMDLFTNAYDEIRQIRAAGTVRRDMMGIMARYSESMESLRQYYGTQVLHVLSDYSDSWIRMLVWDQREGALGPLKGPPAIATDDDIDWANLSKLNWRKVPIGAPMLSDSD